MIDRATALAPGGVTGLSPIGVDLPLAPSGDPGWLLLEEGFTFVREHEIELIFAVANGYIGTRASLEEGGRLSQPATFAAGVYANDPASELGPALAVLPDWPHLEITVDGERLSMESGRIIEHRRMLDLRQGVLWREWRQQELEWSDHPGPLPSPRITGRSTRALAVGGGDGRELLWAHRARRRPHPT